MIPFVWGVFLIFQFEYGCSNSPFAAPAPSTYIDWLATGTVKEAFVFAYTGLCIFKINQTSKIPTDSELAL